MYVGHFRNAQLRAGYGIVLVVLALMSLVAAPATAQQSTGVPSYDVELVIFEHLNSGATDESWGLESSLTPEMAIPDEDASPFDSGTPASSAPTQTFPALAASKFQLTAIEAQLRRSRNYRPIAHIGWTQPGYARNAAPTIPVSAIVPASSGLTGKIALSRGRYLHLTLDLTLATPAGEHYVLRQSRRMRSTERHYIDHPKFGVIALITPSAASAQ